MSVSPAALAAGSDGTYVPQRDVTDLCPTTNMTAGTITGLTSNEELVIPIGPFSAIIEVWRNHMNVRTQ